MILLFFPSTTKEHLERLAGVFKKFKEAGLKLNPSECEFFKGETHYSGM